MEPGRVGTPRVPATNVTPVGAACGLVPVKTVVIELQRDIGDGSEPGGVKGPKDSLRSDTSL